MIIEDIVDAIKFLKPESEFVIRNQDLDNIEWIIVEGVPPTKKEIEEAVKAKAAAKVKAEQEAAAKKAAAEAKLVALGLDLDDLRALGL